MSNSEKYIFLFINDVAPKILKKCATLCSCTGHMCVPSVLDVHAKTVNCNRIHYISKYLEFYYIIYFVSTKEMLLRSHFGCNKM